MWFQNYARATVNLRYLYTRDRATVNSPKCPLPDLARALDKSSNQVGSHEQTSVLRVVLVSADPQGPSLGVENLPELFHAVFVRVVRVYLQLRPGFVVSTGVQSNYTKEQKATQVGYYPFLTGSLATISFIRRVTHANCLPATHPNDSPDRNSHEKNTYVRVLRLRIVPNSRRPALSGVCVMCVTRHNRTRLQFGGGRRNNNKRGKYGWADGLTVHHTFCLVSGN